jgi:hypothetical protein
MNAVLAPAIGLALLGGMAALPPMAAASGTSDSVAAATKDKKAKVYAAEAHGGLLGWIGVDVNPTLKAGKSYKVVLKAQYKDGWVRCQASRTRKTDAKKVGDFKLKGKAPHEYTHFMPMNQLPKAKQKTCRLKDGRVYKVVVPAQHGLKKGVDTLEWGSE